ncbi:hypothetical protein [Sphingobacterium sp. JUb56]|uniref:hypothetical protein n=1 Tax=Sphingobacterium sp. JUb56 TaxID=2587145 RepID=UPI0016072036|nr:hypothetical protein [Sphingobacterium sp. JUb56]MBB2950111.1 hypothetical protein [Sphingobacterium sp. JUb56]
MVYLGKDDELLDILVNQAYLSNAVIYRINVCLIDDVLCVEVNFKIQGSKVKEMKIVFQVVKEYGFNYNSMSFFYNIEMFKLLKCDGFYYISFDPYEDDFERSTMDNDIILFEHFEAYST